MTTTYALDRPKAARALQLMALAGDTLEARGDLFAQGLIGSLWGVELLAAEAGVIPWIVLPSGEKGVAAIGGARVRMEDPTPPKGVAPSVYAGVRAIYLAAHGAARRAHNEVTILGEAPHLPPVGIGFLPQILIAVVAIAAIIATAMYAGDVVIAWIKVQGETARSVARVNAASDLAMANLKKNGSLPPEVWTFLKAEADSEALRVDTSGAKKVLLGVGLTVGVAFGGALLWRRYASK